MNYKYSTPLTENSAKAVGISLPISRKQCYNICKTLKGMNVQKAKTLLQDVIEMKKAISYTKYNGDIGHKAGMSAGRYPVKACKEILMLLKSAEANAQFKGLSTGSLIVKHASAQKGPSTYHQGRRRTKAKRTHIEFVLEEQKQEAPKKTTKKVSKPKTEATQ